uniref:Uncharacterized protein n=1 Tax=Amphimedon queenslandica TaxID=400682 RepID=A0A1X7VLY8_AMPQE
MIILKLTYFETNNSEIGMAFVVLLVYTPSLFKSRAYLCTGHKIYQMSGVLSFEDVPQLRRFSPCECIFVAYQLY